jgi:hypothetical protein
MKTMVFRWRFLYVALLSFVLTMSGLWAVAFISIRIDLGSTIFRLLLCLYFFVWRSLLLDPF